MSVDDNVYYWNCIPGQFVNKHTGEDLSWVAQRAGAHFSGLSAEWYEILAQIILDIEMSRSPWPSSRLQVVAGPAIINMLSQTVSFSAFQHTQVELLTLVGTVYKRIDVYLNAACPNDTVHVMSGGVPFATICVKGI